MRKLSKPYLVMSVFFCLLLTKVAYGQSTQACDPNYFNTYINLYSELPMEIQSYAGYVTEVGLKIENYRTNQNLPGYNIAFPFMVSEANAGCMEKFHSGISLGLTQVNFQEVDEESCYYKIKPKNLGNGVQINLYLTWDPSTQKFKCYQG